MALRPLRWFFTNQFMHLEAFLSAPMRHASVPRELRERLSRRMDTAMRLARWRILLYALIYSAVVSAGITLAGEGISRVFDVAWAERAGGSVFVVAQLLSPLSVLALVALLPLNRTLVLLAADIQVLGMEVVARNVQADGVLPSTQARRLDSE